MPAEITMALATKNALANAVKTAIDAGSAAGSMELRTLADVLLVSLPLSYPCGTVNAEAGELVFSNITTTNSVAVGVANKAIFKTSAGAEAFRANVSNKSGTAFVRMDSVTIQSVDQPIAVTAAKMEF